MALITDFPSLLKYDSDPQGQQLDYLYEYINILKRELEQTLSDIDERIVKLEQTE